MISPVDEPLGTVELTYRLRRRAWRRGYDLEGVLSMIEMARTSQVSTVVATLMAVDEASRRLMEKAGLRLVQKLVGESARPTAAAGSAKVRYALDLT
jgi:RimJ/RimL family protein N-acetyltransferase